MTLKTLLLLAISATAGSASIALATERPEWAIGDSWSYQRVDSTSNLASGSFLQEITGKTIDGYEICVEGQGIYVHAKALTRNLGGVIKNSTKSNDVVDL